MSKQQAAAAIIAFIVLDKDESKKRGKTVQSHISGAITLP